MERQLLLDKRGSAPVWLRHDVRYQIHKARPGNAFLGTKAMDLNYVEGRSSVILVTFDKRLVIGNGRSRTYKASLSLISTNA